MQVIGGLGVSGDTACADHAIAFRMRRLAGLDGTPGGGARTTSYIWGSASCRMITLHVHCYLGHDITP